LQSNIEYMSNKFKPEVTKKLISLLKLPIIQKQWFIYAYLQKAMNQNSSNNLHEQNINHIVMEFASLLVPSHIFYKKKNTISIFQKNRINLGLNCINKSFLNENRTVCTACIIKRNRKYHTYLYDNMWCINLYDLKRWLQNMSKWKNICINIPSNFKILITFLDLTYLLLLLLLFYRSGIVISYTQYLKSCSSAVRDASIREEIIIIIR